MTTITFDTHKFVRRLVAEGATEGQAQAHVDALQEAFASHVQTSSEGFATKADVKEEVAPLRTEMKEMELRLTLRLGGVVAAGIAATAALAKFL